MMMSATRASCGTLDTYLQYNAGASLHVGVLPLRQRATATRHDGPGARVAGGDGPADHDEFLKRKTFPRARL